MENLLILIIIIVGCGILWALPLYIAVNVVLWLFHISFHMTLLQAFGICILLSVIRYFLFGEKEDK